MNPTALSRVQIDGSTRIAVGSGAKALPRSRAAGYAYRWAAKLCNEPDCGKDKAHDVKQGGARNKASREGNKALPRARTL